MSTQAKKPDRRAFKFGKNASGFEKSRKKSFELALSEEFSSCNRTPYPTNLTQCPPKEECDKSFNETNSCYPRYPPYECDYLEFHGGLHTSDRELLGRLYYDANSVLEFGIGESTTIAAHTNVPQFVGVESSLEWIGTTRLKAPSRFMFDLADIGEIASIGFPKQKLPKNIFNYQVYLPASHPKPFDVYFVDGRYRAASAVMCFMQSLHNNEDKKSSL